MPERAPLFKTGKPRTHRTSDISHDFHHRHSPIRNHVAPASVRFVLLIRTTSHQCQYAGIAHLVQAAGPTGGGLTRDNRATQGPSRTLAPPPRAIRRCRSRVATPPARCGERQPTDWLPGPETSRSLAAADPSPGSAQPACAQPPNSGSKARRSTVRISVGPAFISSRRIARQSARSASERPSGASLGPAQVFSSLDRRLTRGAEHDGGTGLP
jgi:hypothetical protein